MRWYLINLRWLFLATFWFLQTGYAQNISDNFYAQRSKQLFPDSLFSTYYYQRVSHFKSLPQTTGDIIFIGNSISDGGEWQELFDDLRIKNRGISGDVSAGVIHRIDEIIERKPAKIFLMIGTNDLARGISTDSLVNNILWIAKYLQIQSPATKLFIQSILPVNETFEKFGKPYQ
jgi:hexosaminidase